MPNHNPFRPEELDFIIANFASMTLKDLASALGRSEGGVKTWTLKLGLRRNNRFEWTPERLAIFERMYPNHSAREIAEILQTTVNVVNSKSRHSSLRKTPEYLAKLNKQIGEQLARSGTQKRFVKGQKPWCYGKKIGTRGRSGETQFKKGQQPCNQVPVGEIRKPSRYWKIKIAEPNVWEFLHLHLWKKAHGEIPKGMCVIFKDKNFNNCTIENLECISRKELYKRNSIHNFPEDLRRAIQTLGNLKRTINRRIKNAQE